VRTSFSIPSSIPLVYMSILMSVPHCLDYGRFVSFEIRNMNRPTFGLFNIVLTIPGPSNFL
jgi:hypothetical protein